MKKDDVCTDDEEKSRSIVTSDRVSSTTSTAREEEITRGRRVHLVCHVILKSKLLFVCA